MTSTEDQEYAILGDKREGGTLTDQEYQRYLVLLNKAFAEGIPKITKTWTEGFGI